MTPGEREMIRLLRAIADKLGVVEPVVEKPVSAASVASVAVEFGRVTTDDATEDIPRQTEEDMVRTRLGKLRRVTRIKGSAR